MNTETSITETAGETPAEAEQRKLCRITIICACALIATLAAVSALIWNKPDFVIAYVPVPILEWAFIGGMVGVLTRLAYQRNTLCWQLCGWIIAKPVIGLFMGAVIYFLVAAGAIAIGKPIISGSDGRPYQLSNILWLNALAFIGGYSDRLSLGLINRVISLFQVEKDSQPKGAEQQQSAST